MLGLKIDQVKGAFFDSAAIIGKLSKVKRKVMSKAGAFIRTAARSRIRKRKKPSAPGQSPSAHSKDQPNLKTILFFYDAKNDSVIVGPVKFNQVDYDSAYRPVRGTVPETLEYGGTIAIRERLISLPGGVKKWIRADQRFKSVKRGDQPQRKRVATYAPRPFMRPALKQESAKVAAMFKDQL